MTVAEADKYCREGHFEASSMLPKIEASVSFIKAGKGRSAVITSLDHALEAIEGKAGTVIR